MISDFDLAQLLQSKIFHDLAGPIGALSNGAEFLRESRNDVHQKAIDLMELSSSQAVARLQYFKYAYGYMPANIDTSVNKINPLITAFFKNTKIEVEWKHDSDRDDEMHLSHGTAKIILSLVLITSQMLLYGGKILITLSRNNDDINFSVTGESSNGIKLERDTVQIIGEKNFNLTYTSQNILPLYIVRLCDNFNANIGMNYTSETIQFSCSMKAEAKDQNNQEHIHYTNI